MTVEPSVTEYAVLGLLGEGPTHGFAIAKTLAPHAEVGRVLTVRRPLVYRALARLVESGLAEPAHREPGSAGPSRVVHRITGPGKRQLGQWLARPVAHVRDLRIEFQLKLTLLARSSRLPLDLIRRQREALQPTFASLSLGDGLPPDHIELWRRHSAAAARSYLEDLERLHTAPPDS